jgi:ARG/rhodanese/phosphatase superfamily protein
MFNRSFLSSIFRNFIGVTAVGGLTLGAVGPTISGSAPSPDASQAAENSWRLLPGITYENITLFPVVSSGGADTLAFLTLDEGLASGEVVVSEQGSGGMFRPERGTPSPGLNAGAAVDQLVLINRSKRPLLLLAGELVSGGKQDRIIGKDRIVPVGAEPLPLDVFCVEHGRWSSGSRFSAAKTMVHPSVREQAALAKDQGQVWNAVRAGSTSSVAVNGRAEDPLAAPVITADSISESVQVSAPTQAYSKIYEDGRVGASVDEMVSKLERRFEKAVEGLKGERVVGVIVAYGDEVAWSDIFASPGLFNRYWMKLLRSYAVEALARPGVREVATEMDARKFLRRLNGKQMEESEPNVYRWREITEGRLALIELDALTPKPVTIHRLFVLRTS